MIDSKTLGLTLLILFALPLVHAQGTWSCSGSAANGCLINQCDPGFVPNGFCEINPFERDQIDFPDDRCTGQFASGDGTCVPSTDTNPGTNCDTTQPPTAECLGQIVRVSTGTTMTEYLGAPNGWLAADGQCSMQVAPGPITVNGHSFIKVVRSNSPHQWVECSDAPYNDPSSGGINLGPDQAIMCQPGTLNVYCTTDNQGKLRFTSNLDRSQWSQACNNLGFSWTGNYCCSENPDTGESYNDPGGSGACFRKNFQPNNQYLTRGNGQIEKSVLVVNGVHEACQTTGDPVSGYNAPGNNDLTSMTSEADPYDQNIVTGPLVQQHNYCEKITAAGTEYYCSFQEEWLPVDGQRTTLKRIAWPSSSAPTQQSISMGDRNVVTNIYGTEWTGRFDVATQDKVCQTNECAGITDDGFSGSATSVNECFQVGEILPQTSWVCLDMIPGETNTVPGPTLYTCTPEKAGQKIQSNSHEYCCANTGATTSPHGHEFVDAPHSEFTQCTSSITGAIVADITGRATTPTEPPYVYTQPGPFHSPTELNPSWQRNLNVPNGEYEKITVDMDVTLSDWNPQPRAPTGTKNNHNLFWLYRGQWRSNTFLYVNAFGPSNPRVKISSNTDYQGTGIPPGGAVDRSANLQPGQTYHVYSEFDATTKTYSTTITQGSATIATISNPAQYLTGNSFSPGSRGFIMFVGHDNPIPEGPETRTIGWTYSNLEIRFTPKAGTSVPSPPPSQGSHDANQAQCCAIDQCWDSNSCVSPGTQVRVDQIVYTCENQNGAADWTFEGAPQTDEEVCISGGNTWTGSACCGDNTQDYYIDSAGEQYHGCWDGTAVENNTFTPTSNDVRLENFEFIGCAIDSDVFDDPQQNENKPFNAENDALLNLDNCADQNCNSNANDLITDENYCAHNVDQAYFCSYTEQWLPTEGRSRPTLKYLGWPDQIDWTSNPSQIVQAQCCESDRCWDGTSCQQSQAADPRTDPNEYGLRCVDGDWQQAFNRTTWNNQESGYCPYAHQCLVNPLSLNSNTDLGTLNSVDLQNPIGNDIQCINSTAFIGDHYCDNGNWTSRTQLVALQLLNVAQSSANPNQYTLYCDEYSDAVNYFDYTIASLAGLDRASDFFTNNCNYQTETLLTNDQVPCAANVCVLKYQRDADSEEEVIFGVALNQLPSTTPHSFLNLLAVPTTYCDSVTSGGFNRCSNPDVWYSPNHQSIVYAKEGVNLNDVQFTENFVQFIQNPFQTIFDVIINTIRPTFPGGEQFDFNFIADTQDFSRIYMSKKGSKMIHGVMEQLGNQEFFSVAYYDFSGDVCASVGRYVEATNPIDVISCDRIGNDYFVETLNPTRFNTWKTFTARVRVQ